jgi:hypothetical protein
MQDFVERLQVYWVGAGRARMRTGAGFFLGLILISHFGLWGRRSQVNSLYLCKALSRFPSIGG